MVLGPIVRNVDSGIQRIVIFFSIAPERHKKHVTTSVILTSQEIKSDLNSKILNFNMGFTSY